jgi:hypothetical protein
MRQNPKSGQIHRIGGTPWGNASPGLWVFLVLLAAQVFAPGSASAQPSVVISEFVAGNVFGLSDEDDDEEDWIELHNLTAQPLSLDGWYLTDEATDPTKWRIPAVSVAAGAHLVVFASEKNRTDPAVPLHTNFKLDLMGEYLALVRPDGATVEHAYAPKFPEQFQDFSYGLAGVTTRTLLVRVGDTARFLIPADGGLGTTWLSRTFDDSAWSAGTTGVGYETQSGYEGLIGTADVESQMYGVNATAYIRLSFAVSDPSKTDKLLLRMKYDDGFVAFLNGTEVAGANRPATPAWNSGSSGNHPDAQAMVFVEYDISAFKSLLVAGGNVLAVHGLNDGASNSDFLIVPELEAIEQDMVGLTPRYFAAPTPGTTNGNGQAAPGPGLSAHGHSPACPSAAEDIITTAVFSPRFHPLASVTMTYRVTFGSETAVPMVDNGTGADQISGDGIYTAVIPRASYAAGNMVRWFYTARDSFDNTSRWPQFPDPYGSPQYYGTIVEDTTVTTNLPVVYWFVEDTWAVTQRTGTRCSVWHNGEFYDNIFVRNRGGGVTSWWPKPKMKFDFNRGYHFHYLPNQPLVEELNFQPHWFESGVSPSTYVSYMRETLATWFFKEIGVPAQQGYHVHLRQNGQFFGLYSMLDQIDEHFLRRCGLDQNGIMYKASGSHRYGNLRENPGLDRGEGPYAGYKITLPKVNGNWDALNSLTAGVNLPDGPARLNYLLDNINLPEVVNEMAGHATMQHHDRLPKNYYMYLDPKTLEWSRFPFDLEQAFEVDGDAGPFLTGSNYSTPLYGDSEHGQDGSGSDSWNHLYDAILDQPLTREMYMRRLRTLMDKYLKPSPAGGYFEPLVNATKALIETDARADDAKWHVHRQPPYDGPEYGDIDYGVSDILNVTLPTRRDQLFNLYGPGGATPLIPGAQPSHPAIQFGTIEFFPASGNQDEEYVQLTNPNTYAVDISGWKLAGGVNHVFKPGTVIIHGNSLYVSPNVAAFRNRAISPKRGEGRFVQGNYQGRLSNTGETLYLVADDGTTISQVSYAGLPALTQGNLRVSELHFDPLPPTTAELAVNPAFTASDFEFIELTNPTSLPIELQGVHFTNGVVFTFAASLLLQPGEYVLALRNRAAFEARYGAALPVAGEYAGKLDNNGETVRIEDVSDNTIVEFTYTDGRGWPVASQGAGHSMVPVPSAMDAESSGSLDYCGNWRASAYVGGSPGAPDPEIRDVVLNEIVAHTDIVQPPYDSNDQIEIYNTSSALVSLNDWYLSDNKANLKKWHIAEDFASIPANGRLLFDEIQNFHNPITGGFGIDKRGEQVYLSYLPGNSKDRVADAVRFKGQENGRSLSRFPDGQQYWYATLPTPGAANTGPVADIVISEIQYNPSDTSEMTEFVELHNPTGSDINLFDVAGAWRLDGGVSYTFPAAVTIPAGGHAVVAPFDPATSLTELAAFRGAYGLSPGEPALLYGPYTGKLSNRTDRIAVERPQEEDVPGEGISWVIVDEAIYFDQAPWTPEADGAGLSLNRLAEDFSGNAPGNWAAWVPNPGKSSDLLGVRLSSAAVPDGWRTNASPIAFTVSFSRAVNGFEPADIVVANGAVTAGSFNGQNGAAVYTFTVTPAAPAIVTVRIPENAALAVSDGKGNVNSPLFSFIFTQALTVALSSPIGEGGLTRASPVAFTATFSRAVNGFAAGDIVVTNGAVTAGSFSGQNGAAVYGFTVTPAAPGIVTVRIPANAAGAVEYGEKNAASPVFTFTYERMFTSPAATQMPWWLLGNE